MDDPTAIVGQTQSGKTWRAFRLFVAHEGPAVFCDVQYRAKDYLREPHVTAYTVEEIVAALEAWKWGDPWPRVAWRLDDYKEFPRLFEYLFKNHKAAHVADRTFPRTAVFVDEAALAANRYADEENALVRLFTQGYQHGIVGVAVTQRPSMVSRNVLGNAWTWYVFAVAPEDMVTLRENGRTLPDPAWVADPLQHHYLVYRAGRWSRGDAEGNEDEMSQGAPPQGAIPATDERGDRAGDVGVEPVRRVPEVSRDLPKDAGKTGAVQG